jgi:Fic family protein
MIAVVEAVAHDIIASSEIEGVELNNAQVRSSVARKLGVTLAEEVSSSRYIDGVVEMALDATENYATPLTHERLFGWHNCLFPTGWSGAVEIDVAKYRKGEMKVVSGMFGRERVHYIAPTAEKVNEEMEQFLTWFNSNQTCDYVKSAIAHLWFVCIHPFDDGNGRVGRLILIKECLRFGIDPFIIDDKRRGNYNQGIAEWPKDHTLLTGVCLEAQERLNRQRELCKLMQFCRSPIHGQS